MGFQKKTRSKLIVGVREDFQREEYAQLKKKSREQSLVEWHGVVVVYFYFYLYKFFFKLLERNKAYFG